jgi:hypothetical protein
MPDYESMTIEQLEAEGHRVEGLISDLRTESRARAKVLDRKIRLQLITPTDRDQVIVAPSILDRLRAKLPAALFADVEKHLSEDK